MHQVLFPLRQTLELLDAALAANEGFLLQVGKELFCAFKLFITSYLTAHLRGLRLHLRVDFTNVLRWLLLGLVRHLQV